MSNRFLNKARKIWRKQGERIITMVIIVLVAAISYNAGIEHEKDIRAAEIKVTLNNSSAANPRLEKIIALGEALERASYSTEGVGSKNNNHFISEGEKGQKESLAEGKVAEDTENKAGDNKECVFIGSKASDKYHLPTCRWVEKIKPENRICFSSKEEAEKAGYLPAKCCIK